MAAGAHQLIAPGVRRTDAATARRRRLAPGAADAPVVDLALPAPLRAVLTTAAAGDMRDPAAWRRVCAALDVAPGRVRRVTQRHTQRVVAAAGGPTDADLPADGLIAAADDDVLCVSVADCLPIFLMPGDGRLPALLHSGWRGTGIVTGALDRLRRRFGRSPAAYRAIIGPGIGRCCYEVPAERARRFRDRFGAEAAEVAGTAGRIDLRAANVALLRRAGVAEIIVYDDCSACSPALLSFRADRARGRDGTRRMAALLGRFGAASTARNASGTARPARIVVP